MSVIRRSAAVRPSALNPFRRRWLPAHAALLGLCISLPLAAAEEETTQSAEESSVAPLVITSSAPDSPLTVVADPQSEAAGIYRQVARDVAARIALQSKDFSAKFPTITVSKNT